MISILLATQNGAYTLPPLLRSIHGQTHQDWQLLARDDGSADATQRVLTVAASRDRRVVPVRDWTGSPGRSGSFDVLMRAAMETPARYFAFADQDDVWLADKLSRQGAALCELEAAHGPHVPLLVHTDLRVVDEELTEIRPSLTRYLGSEPSCLSSWPLPVLLAGNFVTACTAICNRPLLEGAMPLPAEAVSHDWWLALYAAAAGQIRYLPVATVKYRLHAGNVKSRIGSRLRIRRWLGAHRHLPCGAGQAGALAQRLREHGQPAEATAVRVLDQYANLFEARTSRWRRSWGVCRLAAGRPGFANRLLLAGAAALSRPAVGSFNGDSPHSEGRSSTKQSPPMRRAA